MGIWKFYLTCRREEEGEGESVAACMPLPPPKTLLPPSSFVAWWDPETA